MHPIGTNVNAFNEKGKVLPFLAGPPPRPDCTSASVFFFSAILLELGAACPQLSTARRSESQKYVQGSESKIISRRLQRPGLARITASRERIVPGSVPSAYLP
jgi:hypothetical protein